LRKPGSIAARSARYETVFAVGNVAQIWRYTHPANVDTGFRSEHRKLLLQASRNGYHFVLGSVARRNLLTTSFATLNWATGIDGDDQDLRFASESIKPLFFLVRLVPAATVTQCAKRTSMHDSGSRTRTSVSCRSKG
jgi:hypothetical protein